MSGARDHALAGTLGLALGAALSLIGFTDWGEVNRMFRFVDLRLLFTFAGAVALSALAYRLLGDAGAEGRKVLHPGVVPGSILFGIGWAVSGACPAIALVQVGEGQVAALATLAGLLAGTALYRPAHARLFKWDRTGGCA